MLAASGITVTAGCFIVRSAETAKHSTARTPASPNFATPPPYGLPFDRQRRSELIVGCASHSFCARPRSEAIDRTAT